MVLKELVLNGLESFDSYKFQYSYYKGEVKELAMTQELYEKFADHEIKHFYLNKDQDGKPYISIMLK